MDATKSTWFMTPALLLAASLSGQTFTVEGVGAGPVDLPEPLTSGAWTAELERFSETRADHGTVCWPSSIPSFAIESVDYRDTHRLRRVDEAAGGRFSVGVRGFPAGAAKVQVTGSLTDSPDPSVDPRLQWTLRFTKDGTPKPTTKPADSFVVYGRGSPLEVPLPEALTRGIWRVDLQTYKEGKPFGVYVRGGDFYLTSDFKRHCTVVSGRRNRSRVNVGVDVAVGLARLMPRQIQPAVLWSVRFTKDGAPLSPDPPSPPDDCPSDSVCRADPAPDPAPEPDPDPAANPAEHTTAAGHTFRVSYFHGGAWKRAEVATRSGDSAAFHFFGPDNLEVFAKVLNGCGIDGSIWVYAAGLTDLPIALHVRRRGTDRWHPFSIPDGTVLRPQNGGRLRWCS